MNIIYGRIYRLDWFFAFYRHSCAIFLAPYAFKRSSGSILFPLSSLNSTGQPGSLNLTWLLSPDFKETLGLGSAGASKQQHSIRRIGLGNACGCGGYSLAGVAQKTIIPDPLLGCGTACFTNNQSYFLVCFHVFSKRGFSLCRRKTLQINGFKTALIHAA